MQLVMTEIPQAVPIPLTTFLMRAFSNHHNLLKTIKRDQLHFLAEKAPLINMTHLKTPLQYQGDWKNTKLLGNQVQLRKLCCCEILAMHQILKDIVKALEQEWFLKEKEKDWVQLLKKMKVNMSMRTINKTEVLSKSSWLENITIGDLFSILTKIILYYIFKVGPSHLRKVLPN